MSQIRVTSQRMVNDFLRNAWGIRVWTCIQQLNTYAFKVGFKDQKVFEEVDRAKWG